MRSFVRAGIVLCVVLGTVACDDDEEPDERFIANMTGAAERPDPVDTDASGTARFERDGGVVSYTLDVEDITGVVAAHIHGPADSNTPAGVIVTLFTGPAGGTSTVNGRLEEGSFSETEVATISMDSLLVLMREGQSYVNVHTTEHLPGEIRGQIQED